MSRFSVLPLWFLLRYHVDLVFRRSKIRSSNFRFSCCKNVHLHLQWGPTAGLLGLLQNTRKARYGLFPSVSFNTETEITNGRNMVTAAMLIVFFNVILNTVSLFSKHFLRYISNTTNKKKSSQILNLLTNLIFKHNSNSTKEASGWHRQGTTFSNQAAKMQVFSQCCCF